MPDRRVLRLVADPVTNSSLPRTMPLAGPISCLFVRQFGPTGGHFAPEIASTYEIGHICVSVVSVKRSDGLRG